MRYLAGAEKQKELNYRKEGNDSRKRKASN